jgi:hypothetical protein
MSIEQNLFIPGPCGRLEARVGEPAPDLSGSVDAIAVILHPHPLFQGSLENKVVFTLTRAASASGAHTVRFNFRGVGKSDGRYGEGVGELADVHSIVTWARAQWGPAPELWLLGFSFGAGLAIQSALELKSSALVTIAPPVPHLTMAPDRLPTCPWLIIQGESDEIVPAAAVTAWSRELPGHPVFELWPEVTHFFHGQLGRLRSTVSRFLAERTHPRVSSST